MKRVVCPEFSVGEKSTQMTYYVSKNVILDAASEYFDVLCIGLIHIQCKCFTVTTH